MQKREYLLILAALVALVSLAQLGCEEEDGVDGASDADVDGDSDGDGDGPLTTGYFVVDMMRTGRLDQDEACDLTGDGDPDNALKKLLNSIPANMLAETPDETIANRIASGDSLTVVELSDMDNFENDDELNGKGYKGLLDDPDAGVLPDDLLSGHGSIRLEKPHKYELNGASLVDGVFHTPETVMAVEMPMGTDVYLMDLYQATMTGRFAPPPTEQMIDGKVVDGLICGAIPVAAIKEMISNSPDIPAVLKNLVKQTIGGFSDVQCNGGPCLSMGMVFTAVSVQIKE